MDIVTDFFHAFHGRQKMVYIYFKQVVDVLQFFHFFFSINPNISRKLANVFVIFLFNPSVIILTLQLLPHFLLP